MAKADRVLSTPPTNTPVDAHDAAPFGKAALTFGGRTPSKPVTAG
jgi:hypothetical protein